uniref:YjiS-like domain-containing protein n=1 Tax=Rhodopseudomonas palustris (strain BisA53) TaxID=316055 RepID=Q07JX5_RHOP5
MSICSDQSMTNHHELGFLVLAGAVLHTWRERQRTRRELARFSERDLHDVGLSWSDVAYEIDKPFWRA